MTLSFFWFFIFFQSSATEENTRRTRAEDENFACVTRLPSRAHRVTLVIGVLFLACLFFAPLATSLPKEIDGAALLYVAILFVRNITDIDWNDIAESGPAVLAMIVMPLTYSISNGIALAFIAYALIRIFTGKFGQTSPAIWVIAVFSVLSFYVA